MTIVTLSSINMIVIVINDPLSHSHNNLCIIMMDNIIFPAHQHDDDNTPLLLHENDIINTLSPSLINWSMYLDFNAIAHSPMFSSLMTSKPFIFHLPMMSMPCPLLLSFNDYIKAPSVSHYKWCQYHAPSSCVSMITSSPPPFHIYQWYQCHGLLIPSSPFLILLIY